MLWRFPCCLSQVRIFRKNSWDMNQDGEFYRTSKCSQWYHSSLKIFRRGCVNIKNSIRFSHSFMSIESRIKRCCKKQNRKHGVEMTTRG